MKRRALLATFATATTAGCGGIGSNATTTPATDARTHPTSSSASETTAPSTTETAGPESTTDGEATHDDVRTVDDWSTDDVPAGTLDAPLVDDVAFPTVVADWRVSMWNDVDRARTFRVVAATPDGRVLDESVVVPADAWVLVRLPQVVPYDVRVAVDGERAWSRSVDEGDYACGAWDTNVVIRDDSSEVLLDAHQSVGCPRVARFRTLDATTTCNEDPVHAGSGAFRDGAVELSGRVATPNACYAVFHDGPVYDFGARTLRVSIVGSPYDSSDCAPCNAEHAYDFTIPVDGAYPKQVVVDHTVATGEGYRIKVVARATRPGED